jgi:arylsulfatase A-like enzyme
MLRLTHREVAAARVEKAVSTLDIVPTILREIGVEPGPELDGSSLLEGGSDEVMAVWQDSFSFRIGDWKLYMGNHEGLYDISADPEERNNLYETNQEVLQDLFTRAQKAYSERLEKDGDGQQIEKEMQEIVEKLKAIGYI